MGRQGHRKREDTGQRSTWGQEVIGGKEASKEKWRGERESVREGAREGIVQEAGRVYGRERRENVLERRQGECRREKA